MLIQADESIRRRQIIYGKIENVEELFHEVGAERDKPNLKLSENKCNLWMPMAGLKMLTQLQIDLASRFVTNGITVLRVPVRKDEWTLQIISDEASNLKKIVRRLED